MGFGQRLYQACGEYGRLCVGIDPHAGLLRAWGLSEDAAGLKEFTARCVEAFAGHAALVKPQVAFFERFGSAGYAILEQALRDLREAGTLVLADAKRGDIGSTMEGYANAWLAPGSLLQADAVTLSPYLGVGALEPAFALSRETGAGVFVLAATSNPEARALQSQGGPSIAQQVVDECAQRNKDLDREIGNIGVVVGATLDSPPDLRELNAPVLMPGVGAQGASVADVKRISAGALGIASVSRSVLVAGPQVTDLRKVLESQAREFDL